MTVLVRVVLSLVFSLFLGIVHFLVVHGTSNADGVAHMIRQVGLIALQFPSRTVVGHQFVLIAIFLQTAGHLADFAAIVVAVLRGGSVVVARAGGEPGGGEYGQARKSEEA